MPYFRRTGILASVYGGATTPVFDDVAISYAHPLVNGVYRRLFLVNQGHLSQQNHPFPAIGCGYVGDMPHHTVLPKLGIVSTYLPRRCGLATYTADLRQALDVSGGDLTPVVVAIDRDGLKYGDEVVATIRPGRCLRLLRGGRHTRRRRCRCRSHPARVRDLRRPERLPTSSLWRTPCWTAAFLTW